MSIQTIILIVVTVCNVLVVADAWVHRRERREFELEQLAKGSPSLQAQIDSLKSELRQTAAAQEGLRLERASIVSREMAALNTSLAELHEKASDFGSEMQRSFGRMSERVAAIEQNVSALMATTFRKR